MIPQDVLNCLEKDLPFTTALKQVIDGFTEIEYNEDSEIVNVRLNLESRYTVNMGCQIWFDPQIGYDSIGLVDTCFGEPYVDFGTFHTDGEGEAFVLYNEERRWHPVIAIQSFVKRSNELKNDLLSVVNGFLKIHSGIERQAFYVGGLCE